MSSIRITTVVPSVGEIPNWVREAMLGSTIGIDGSASTSDLFVASPEAIVHGIRSLSDHPDAPKAADWFEQYFKHQPFPLRFRGDWCEYLP
jgi:hypothetical protein